MIHAELSNRATLADWAFAGSGALMLGLITWSFRPRAFDGESLFLFALSLALAGAIPAVIVVASITWTDFSLDDAGVWRVTRIAGVRVRTQRIEKTDLRTIELERAKLGPKFSGHWYYLTFRNARGKSTRIRLGASKDRAVGFVEAVARLLSAQYSAPDWV